MRKLATAIIAARCGGDQRTHATATATANANVAVV